MSISSEEPPSECPAEIGPPPYYHRSDRNICRKQDGLKTRSQLFPGVDGARAPLPPLARTEEEQRGTPRSGLPGAAAPSHGGNVALSDPTIIRQENPSSMRARGPPAGWLRPSCGDGTPAWQENLQRHDHVVAQCNSARFSPRIGRSRGFSRP
jgi:hypothetical protein